MGCIPPPPIPLSKTLVFMELLVRVRCKHDITKGLLTAIRKQKSYGLIFRYLPMFCCKHHITNDLIA